MVLRENAVIKGIRAMNIGSHGRANALSTSSAKRLGVSLAFAVLAGITPAMAHDRFRASSGGAGSEMVYRLAFEGSTANESTGTVVPTMWIDGDPVYSTDAKVGASSFKTTGGCPAIIATDAAPLATTNTGYAITFWFKDDGAQSWSDFMGFRIGKGNYGFEMAGSGVMQLYDANLDSTGQGGGLGALVPAYSFAPSAWHHIAVVVPRNSNGTVNIYLDGGNKRTVDIPTYGKSGALNDFGAGQLTEVLVGGRRAKRAEGADPRTYLMGSPWLIDDLAIFTGDFTDGDVVRMAASPEQNVPVAYNTLADDLIWLPIGDSITEGEQYMGHEDQGDINTRGGYRYQMWRQLEAGGQGVRSVGFRTGHMGTVEDAATCKWARHSAQYGGVITHDNNGSHGAAGLNVENTLEVAGFPDIITAMIGVNDLSFTGQNTTEVVDQYRWVFATCERMVRKYALQRPNTRFFLSTLFPAGGNRGYITGYNKLMRQKAADKESPFDLPNVELVDVNELGFGGTFVASDFKSDNLHPNEMGAMKAASGFNSRIWSYIDELAASTALPVAIDNASVGTVKVLFSKKLAASATATLTIRDADGAQHVFSGPTVDGRSLVFTIGGATLASGPATATLSNVSGEDGNGVALASGYDCADCGTVIDIQGSGAEENVPAAFRAGFVKYQTIDIGNGESYKTGISLGDKYAGNGPTAATGLVQEDVAMSGVSRVGYYMELKRPNRPAQFVWASMDADAFGGMLSRIGVPTVAVGNIKANVSNLQVYSNRPTVTSTAVTEGVVDTTQKGVVEFSPYDWTGTDQAGFIADLNGGKTGWNDTLGSSTLKGCMQIARVNEGYQAGSATDNYSKIAGEMVFAYNNFNKADSPSDIGIGSFSSHRADTSSNSATPTLDWTDFVSQTEFTDFAVDAYEIKKLEIWAKEDPDAQPEINGMKLEFAEEFNGDELDSRFWTPEHGLVRNVNARQMYLADESVLSVSNGALNITVRYAPGTQNPFYDSTSSDWRKNTATQNYKSAAVDSWGKLAFRYGHAEVRARYSVATGAWPALWLVGQDLSRVDSFGDLNVPENHHRALTQDSWPMVGEIDLQEYATKAQWSEKVNSTLHYGDYWEGAKYKTYGMQYEDASLNVPSIEDADWHVYTLDVDETTITIGYDGHTVLTRQQSELKNPDSGKYPFRDNHFYFIFNYALGSMSEEPPADGAGYPLKMEIDYVRLYQDPTKDNGLFFGNSALRHHVTSSYAGGVYAYREGDSMPLVYSTGNAVANMLTIEVLAELEKGESGAICGWLEGSHPVQLVYNAKTDRFDITYDGSTSHAKTVSYAPQDVTKPHVYTVAITARSTGVKVYQDGVLIVDAPNIYWSGDQYKITDKLTIGSAADLTQLSPGMKVYAVDWYFPTVSADCERVFSTYGMTGSAAALGTGMKAMLASLAGGATSTTLPSVTVNGVVLPAAESVETLYAIGAPITSDKSLDFALTGMDPFAGNLTSRLSESLVKGSLTVFGSATLKDCWARVAAFPGATASDSDVLPVGDAIERGYRFFKSAIESGTPDTAGYENMMVANLPSKDFTVNYKKSGEQFRIPSLCRGGDTVVALYDMRPYADDLGVEQSTGSYSPIDIAGNVSSDGGRTWGESQVMIDVPNCYDYISGTVNNQTGHPDGDYDIGDVCTLFDETTRMFFAMGITGGGLSARDSDDRLGSWNTALYTRDEGASARFVNRRLVRDELLAKLAAKGVDTSFTGNSGILAGPGHGIQTKVRNAGRLVFPMQYFGPDGTRVFAAYSDDHGETWEVTGLAPSGYNSQENSIAEMDDGSWYMIAKKGGGHGMNGRHLLRTDDFENWTYLGEFTPSSSVQGSLLKLGQRASDGKGVYAMAFCTTGGPGTTIAQARWDLKMYFGVDAGDSIDWNADDYVEIWKGPTGGKGYNSMAMLDDGKVGILFEANGHIYFRHVDIRARLL